MNDFPFSPFLPSHAKEVISEFLDSLDCSKVSSFDSSSDSNVLLTQFFYDGFVSKSSLSILTRLPFYVTFRLCSNHNLIRFDFVLRVPLCYTFDSSDTFRCLCCPYCLPPSDRIESCLCKLSGN